MGAIGTTAASPKGRAGAPRRALSRAEMARLAARSRGAATAPLTVLELSDFQCDDCWRFARDTLPVLERRYIESGVVRWVFLNWPKAHKHRHAVRAAQYGLCAGLQDRFWPMHDRLFDAFERWTDLEDPDPVFADLAHDAGVDVPRLRQDLISGRTLADLDADAAYIGRWGAEYVPSFNVGGVVVPGARSADYLSGVIDAVLHAGR